MFKQVLLYVMVSVFLMNASYAQKHWVFFKNENKPFTGKYYVSEAALHNREMQGLPLYQPTDVPLNEQYLETIRKQDVEVICKSKWLNAVSANLTPAQVDQLLRLDIVEAIEPIDREMILAGLGKGEEEKVSPWYWAYRAFDGDQLKEMKLSGKGVNIGVIDGGFRGVPEHKALKQLVKNNQVKGMKNFEFPGEDELFAPQYPDQSNHGMYVLQMIAGKDKKRTYGLATGAHFYLAKSDNKYNEFKGEEDYWVESLEWLDSLGVRLVNSSLGYTRNFDDPSENYQPGDMNGEKSIVAKAAKMAVREKGMIIVSSVGNEGDDEDWKVISTPSDVEEVISVGTSDLTYYLKLTFSGIGPENHTFMKPNVICPSADGTSFSAPFITGLIACMLEKKPDMSPAQVKEMVEKSAQFYPFGNNFTGYGIPQARRVLKLLEDSDYDFENASEMHVATDSVWVDLKSLRKQADEPISIVYKKNKYDVYKQAFSHEDRMQFYREPECDRITISSRNKVVELFWD